MTDRNEEVGAPGPRRSESLVDMVSAPVEAPAGETLSKETWLKIAFVGGLLLAVHHWQFPFLIGQWLHDPNWSHGFLIPLFSLYLLYARRWEIRAAKRGVLAQILSHYPVGVPWLTSLTIPLILFGVVLYLAGPEVARLTWLPIFYLALAMPMPSRLYTAIALPLQQFAALASTILLRLLGVEISVVASRLTVIGRSGTPHGLTVAEACSGVRSLLAFVAVGVAIAYLENRPAWQRVVLVVFTVPIAIFLNVIRVAITCAMYVIDKPELGQDFMHEFMGLVMLIPAFALLWALGWLLRKLLVEEDEVETDPAKASQEGVTT